MSKRFFTSDFHIGHENIIRYCDCPFVSALEMDRYLQEEWNNTVGPNDFVYFLGDFCFDWKRACQVLKTLNGKIVFVSGNHDKCFIKDPLRPESKFISHYENSGCVKITQKHELTLKDGTEVILSHFPYLNPRSDGIQLRYSTHRPIDSGKFLLHGHMHCHYVKSGTMIDVGIDHNFKLYSEDEVISIINDPRPFIPSRLTEFYKKTSTKPAPEH